MTEAEATEEENTFDNDGLIYQNQLALEQFEAEKTQEAVETQEAEAITEAETTEGRMESQMAAFLDQ